MPTHFFGGISDAMPTSMFYDMPAARPNRLYTFFDDFNMFAAADWTITTTEAGAGDAAEALTDEQFGALLVTNDAADNDADFFQKKGESFKFVSGKQLWFEARFKVSDATQSDFVIGLQITDTTPLAVTDGVYFLKADGSTTVNCLVTKNSTSTTTAAATLASDTFITLGFYYDGASTIQIWADDLVVATSVTTNLVDDEELTISFGIQNGEAVAKTLTIDYILACKER